MSHNTQRGEAMPTINVAINRSRLKSYSKDGKPTYYLKNGTEFQIEVFNPTTEMVSARISLNGKKIGQGGLVLRPGERVFLDRYIDVAKKFKFETYEVSNTAEVRKAIEKNGDLTVTFHKEYVAPTYRYYDFDYDLYRNTPWNEPIHPWNTPSFTPNPYTFYGTTSAGLGNVGSATCDSRGIVATNSLNDQQMTGSLGMMSANASSNTTFNTASLGANSLKRFGSPETKSKVRSRSKSIETGRVEEGSRSSQKFTQVQITFNEIPFKTYQFNLLPESTKPVTSKDLNNRRYCHNCGSKAKANYKFCPNCGTKS